MAPRSISLESARSLGHKRYFTGVPCKNGHVAERQVSNKTCVECAQSAARARYLEDSSKVRKRALEWSRSNPERNRSRVRKWQVENRAHTSERWKIRYASDPSFKCAVLIRGILARVLSASKTAKQGSTCELLGYSAAEFRSHIERQFGKGMSWDNHGQWHVDHIVPVIEMIESGQADPKVVNALSNLMPIWAKENLTKGRRKTCLL